MLWFLLGGPVVKNLPANVGNTDLILGPETKIPHAMDQLSPCATKTWIAKPQLQSNYFGKSRVGPETALLTSSQMVVMLLV